MTPPDLDDSFLAPLAALQNLILRLNGRGVIIGGIAASLLGKPRLTADVDALVLVEDGEISTLLEYAEKEGLHPRMAQAEEFALKHRVVLLKHTPSGIHVDVALGMLPVEEEAIRRSRSYQIGELVISLPSPEDLIIFKAVAHRPRDLADIEGIIQTQPELDWTRIERHIRELASGLDMPEIWVDVSSIRTKLQG